VSKVNEDPPAPPPDEPPQKPFVAGAPDPVDDTGPKANPRPRPAVTAKKKDPGSVRVSSYPWAYASVNGQRKYTPDTFRLPPGRYTVKLEFPTLNVVENRVVVIESNRMSQLRVDKRDD
jgi:hypothetical protein